MNEISQILNDLADGNAQAADQLLPLVYEQLRKLAAHKLAQEKPGQTLEASALAHDAYLRPDCCFNPRRLAGANYADRANIS